MARQIDQLRKGTTTMALLKLLEDVGEPLHGYAIIQRLEARTKGALEFKEGLIYPTLHRMEQEGLLESRWLGEPGTRRRKVYTVTDQGRRRLRRELLEWETFSDGMGLLLGLSEART
jgi:PadR family transcriptional regulator PadR